MTSNTRDPHERNVLQFETDHSIQRDPALTRIETYWSKVRAGRVVPARSEINPRGLDGVLANAFVVERVSQGFARLRIAGSHMTDFLGMEARGLPLSTLFCQKSREALADALEAVFEEPSTVRFSLTSETGFGRPELIGGMVLLPLRSDLGDITRILGGVSLSGAIGRTPRRLTITGQSRRALVGYAAHPGQCTGLEDCFAAETAPERPISRIRSDHLRLVVVND